MTGGNWAWDVPVAVCDQMITAGATRNTMYCPNNPDQNVDGLWGGPGGYSQGYRVTGYAFTFPGTASVTSTNQNPKTIPAPITFGPTTYSAPPTTDRPLIADVVLSMVGQGTATPAAEAGYQWQHVPGGYTGAPGAPFPGHRTSHLNRNFPQGGNIGMIDGHVEWRKMQLMLCRTSLTDGDPEFWW